MVEHGQAPPTATRRRDGDAGDPAARSADTSAGPNGYLLRMVRSELLASSELTEQQIDTGGLKITTTISKPAQAAAMAAMADEEPSRRRTGRRRCTRR